MDLVDTGIHLILLILSLGIHECAHAWAAFRFGDPTARDLGRLTLNPIPHIDIFGLIPIILGLPLGWAKPVPVNVMRVRNPSVALPLIAAAMERLGFFPLFGLIVANIALGGVLFSFWFGVWGPAFDWFFVLTQVPLRLG